MEKTWKPTTAGILGIIAGVIGVIFGIVLAALGTTGGGILAVFGLPALGGMIAGATALPLILGIVAIVGSIYALRGDAGVLHWPDLFVRFSAFGFWEYQQSYSSS